MKHFYCTLYAFDETKHIPVKLRVGTYKTDTEAGRELERELNLVKSELQVSGLDSVSGFKYTKKAQGLLNKGITLADLHWSINRR